MSLDAVVALVPSASGAGDPEMVAACGPKGTQSWLCSTVFRVTGNEHAAEVADTLAKPIRVVFVLLVAAVAVAIANRLIHRLVVRLAAAHTKLTELRRPSMIDTAPVSSSRRTARAETIGAVLRSVVGIVIWFIAILTALDELGVNLAPLIAGAGVVGLAIGFGAQALVRDFLSGLFMLLEDQYGVGDVIDAGVAVGVVEGVSLRTTRIRDEHGTVWHVPNGEVRRIGNFSQEWSRAVVDVGISTTVDVAEASRVLQEAAAQLAQDRSAAALVVGAPEVLGVERADADTLVLRVVTRTRPLEDDRVERLLRVAIRDAFAAAGIPLRSV